MNPLPNNLHIHIPPNFSAFQTIAQAVELAAAQGIRALGVSNYYDYSGYEEFGERCIAVGITPVYGLEIITMDDDLRTRGIKINDPGNPGKYYICGKGITQFAPMNDEATKLLGVIRNNDSERMATMVAQMETHFAAQGFPVELTPDTIKIAIAARNERPVKTVFLQERHVALAFQEALFSAVPLSERAVALEKLFGVPSKNPDSAGTVQGEIRSHLMKSGKPAFVTETFVDFDHAYRLILALGGIPCYPTLADGANPICGYEANLDELIADLKARNVHCAELIPIRNTPEVLSRYIRTFRNAGLFVTAGTEHNTPDLLPLEPTCLNGEPIPDDIQAIFREGACVLAAHQEQVCSGNQGFTPGDGQIEKFATIGATLLGIVL